MVATPEVLQNVCIILVEPQTPANIGAVARAMRTMGLSHLVLVRPSPWREAQEVWYIAHGAEEVLESAEECQSLDPALAPLRLLAGTTAGVPQDAAGRREYVTRRVRERAARVKEGCYPLGASPDEFQYAEAYQISEYGRRPSPEELTELFPGARLPPAP